MTNNFIFDQYLNGNPDIGASTIYAHLVTTVPLNSVELVKSTDYVKDSGYLPKPVVATLSPLSTLIQKKWDIAPINFGRVNFKKTVLGVIFVIQVGLIPNVDVDIPFAYFELVNEFDSPAPVRPGNQEVIFKIRNSAAAIIDNLTYKYSTGGYVGSPYYPDLQMMMLTQANSNDPFVGAKPHLNSGTQNFLAPLNGSAFRDKTTFSEVITPATTFTNTAVTIQPCATSIHKFWKAAYFNGSARLTYASYSDFSLEADINANPTKKSVISFNFYPEVKDVQQTLLDLGNWSVVIAANNTVQLLRGASVVVTTTKVAQLNKWNSVTIYQTAQQVFGLSLNKVLSVSAGAQANLVTSSLTLGAKLDGTAPFTGYLCLLSKWQGANALLGVSATFPNAAPWNDNYLIYLPQTSDLTNDELTAPITFNAYSSLAAKSITANKHPRIKNITGNNGQLTNIENVTTNWIYDFGLGKAAIGEIDILFESNLSYTCKNLGVDPYDSSYNSGKLGVEIWASNFVPDAILNNENLANKDFWDIYVIETLHEGEALDLTNVPVKGTQFVLRIPTNIYKYYRYYRIGFTNSVDPGISTGAEMLGILLFNSTLVYPTEYIVAEANEYIPEQI